MEHARGHGTLPLVLSARGQTRAPSPPPPCRLSLPPPEPSITTEGSKSGATRLSLSKRGAPGMRLAALTGLRAERWTLRRGHDPGSGRAPGPAQAGPAGWHPARSSRPGPVHRQRLGQDSRSSRGLRALSPSSGPTSPAPPHRSSRCSPSLGGEQKSWSPEAQQTAAHPHTEQDTPLQGTERTLGAVPLLGTGHVDSHALPGGSAQPGRQARGGGAAGRPPPRGTPLPWRKPLRPLVGASNSTPTP